jgi:hypothetical protein
MKLDNYLTGVDTDLLLQYGLWATASIIIGAILGMGFLNIFFILTILYVGSVFFYTGIVYDSERKNIYITLLLYSIFVGYFSAYIASYVVNHYGADSLLWVHPLTATLGVLPYLWFVYTQQDVSKVQKTRCSFLLLVTVVLIPIRLLTMFLTVN